MAIAAPSAALLRDTRAALATLGGLGCGPEASLLGQALDAWQRAGWEGWAGLRGPGTGWRGLGDGRAAAGWASLPDNVAAMVFGGLPREPSHSASLTCVDWARMTHAHKQAQRFTVDWEPLMPAVASAYGARLASTLPGLEVLELDFTKVARHCFPEDAEEEPAWAPFEVKSILAPLATMPRLRKLTLHCVWLDDADMAALPSLSSLQELSISPATLMNAPSAPWARATLSDAGLAELTKLPRLHTLRLYHFADNLAPVALNPEGYGSLGEIPSLTSLVLSGVTCCTVEGLRCALSRPVRTQLRHLELHGRAGPSMLAAMAEGLPALEHLTLDYLGRHPSQDPYDDLEILEEDWEDEEGPDTLSLPFPRSITSLSLACVWNGDETMSALKLPPGLVSLSLDACSALTGSSLANLQGLSALKTLDLRTNDFNMEGLRDGLALGLGCLRGLTSLSLDAADSLMRAIPRSIEHVRLRGWDNVDFRMAMLPKSVEHLSIEWPTHEDCQPACLHFIGRQTMLTSLDLDNTHGGALDPLARIQAALKKLLRLQRVHCRGMIPYKPQLRHRLADAISQGHPNRPVVVAT
eukprot:jgi/Tetstr1/421727/TSEL_001186.t1